MIICKECPKVEVGGDNGVMAEIIQENLVKDDSGEYWVYGNYKIRLVGDDSPGYHCSSFEDGLELLIEFGDIDIIMESNE